jgi:photosystem II stability/assembly factor-like uncharacterized protein
MKYLILLILLLTTMTIANGQWLKQNVNTTASLRGLSVVNEKVVWASGTGGIVIRTIDGGKTWKVIVVPGAEKLDFRDIEAFDENTAYILSIGNGDSSRIYKTTDGGQTWQLEFQNNDPKAFYDAIACFDRETCFAMSDPVDGKFVLIKRSPGVRSRVGIRLAKWLPIDNSALVAKPGEAAFAASGTCLITQGKNNLFLVTGGSDARVFRSHDRGTTWAVAETPIVKGTSGSGIFSIAMFNDTDGVVVGGNYEKPNEVKDSLAFTNSGGTPWKLGNRLSGYRSGVTYVDKKTIIAVGTNGSDISRDGGATWLHIDGANYNAVFAKGKSSTWAVGPNGHVARLDWQQFLETNGFKQCPRNMVCDGPLLGELHLSHNEVSSNCPKADSACVDGRQIKVSITSQEVPPNWYEYAVTAGHIIGFGANVTWDLSDVKPGSYTITAGIKIPSGDSYTVQGKTITKSVIVR